VVVLAGSGQTQVLRAVIERVAIDVVDPTGGRRSMDDDPHQAVQKVISVPEGNVPIRSAFLGGGYFNKVRATLPGTPSKKLS
jgi:hypothetical protein